jgi:hypothetical protein
LINKFRNTNTTTAQAAKTLEELRVSRRLMFNKFLMRNIIVEVNGKYYLNEQNLIDFRAKKSKILIPFIILILILNIFLSMYFSK